MIDDTGQGSEFLNWTAANWNDLQSIWGALLPEFSEEPATRNRTFHNCEISPQDAGIVFERLFLEAFRLSSAEIQNPFRVPSRSTSQPKEQIDGLVLVNSWQAFLVESKLWRDPVSFGPIALLNHHVDQRPLGTLGLFFFRRLDTQSQPSNPLSTFTRSRC